MGETARGDVALDALMAVGALRLAVIDWDLPDLDGPELCRILRDFNLGRPPYIILLAPAGRESGVPTGLQAGANDIVLLPVSAKELRTRVEFGRRVVELPWGQPSVDGEADAAGLPAADDLTVCRASTRRSLHDQPV